MRSKQIKLKYWYDAIRFGKFVRYALINLVTDESGHIMIQPNDFTLGGR